MWRLFPRNDADTLALLRLYTLCLKNRTHVTFSNNSVNAYEIFFIFGRGNCHLISIKALLTGLQNLTKIGN